MSLARQTTYHITDDLDRPIWGAYAIGRAANLLKDDGTVDLRKTYHKLEAGHLDADKNGAEWVSTPRRLLQNLHRPILTSDSEEPA